MEYIKVEVRVTPLNEIANDLLMAQMGELGFESFAETDYGFDAFIPRPEYDRKVLDNLQLPFADTTLQFRDEIMPDENWNEIWEKNYFQPIIIKDKCIVKSPFHKVNESYKYEILIEPKMAFGTGHHSTTSLMLQYILELDIKGKTVLDMGCGTGILGILCAQREASSVVGIDIDEWAFNNANENIELNSIRTMTIEIGGAEILGNRGFDIILANINRNILLDDIKHYVEVLNPNGLLLLSGFYSEDLDAINAECSAYALRYNSSKKDNNWTAASYTKM